MVKIIKMLILNQHPSPLPLCAQSLFKSYVLKQGTRIENFLSWNSFLAWVLVLWKIIIQTSFGFEAIFCFLLIWSTSAWSPSGYSQIGKYYLILYRRSISKENSSTMKWLINSMSWKMFVLDISTWRLEHNVFFCFLIQL